MINPFVICSVEEQAVYRAYADRETWELQCQALGVPREAARAFDVSAAAYAQTTVYPNGDVVAYLRKLALSTLARGEGMPATAEAAIESEHRRHMQRLADMLEGG